jgi:hypothetical protein
VGRERRLGEHLGDEVEGRAEALHGHVDARRDRIPAGIGVERRAEALRRLDELDRAVPGRALREAAGHEGRHAGEVVGLVHRASGDHERSRDQLTVWDVDGDDPETVVEPDELELGEVVRPGLARRRALGDDGRPARRCRHAAASVGAAAAVGT